MPAKRLSMRKIREVLRLKWAQGLSHRRIAASCGIGRPTVSEYVRRAEEAGLGWPLPDDLDDARLERLLFPPPPDLPAESRGIPDWSHLHKELRHKGVTLFLLWQEYRQNHPEGYQYSWFCEHYRTWQGKLDVVMRQDHRAGENLFVDYAGQTVPVINRNTGDPRGPGLCRGAGRSSRTMCALSVIRNPTPVPRPLRPRPACSESCVRSHNASSPNVS